MENYKFNLIENSKDSLRHAITHVKPEDAFEPSDLKIITRELIHVVELLLKEKLRRVHEAFVWDDIDKRASNKPKTVGLEKAVKRLIEIGKVALTKEELTTINLARELRNDIEHYEFEINVEETKILLGRLLSFIFDFSKTHLELNYEDEYKDKPEWSILIDWYGFFIERSKSIEAELKKEKKQILECPLCFANTYSPWDNKCLLCTHHEQLVTCEDCGNEIFEKDTTVVSYFPKNSDEEDYETICNECYKDMDLDADFTWDQMMAKD